MIHSVSTATNRGIWWVGAAGVLWGLVAVITQALYQLSDTNALSIGFFRLSLSVPLLIILWRKGDQRQRFSRPDILYVGLMGIALALYQVCYFAAIPHLGVSIAALITLCLAPVMVALLAVPLLGEQLNQRMVIALAGAIAGTILLVGPRATSASLPEPTLPGILWALGAAASYAGVILCSRFLAGRYGPLQPITAGFAIGAMALLPFALLDGLIVDYPPAGWFLLVFLALVPTALAYFCFLRGLQTTTATTAGIVALLEPFTSVLLAALLFGERLGWLNWMGGVLLLGSVALLSLQKTKEPPPPMVDGSY